MSVSYLQKNCKISAADKNIKYIYKKKINLYPYINLFTLAVAQYCDSLIECGRLRTLIISLLGDSPKVKSQGFYLLNPKCTATLLKRQDELGWSRKGNGSFTTSASHLVSGPASVQQATRPCHPTHYSRALYQSGCVARASIIKH